jgi:hypothetical protein
MEASAFETHGVWAVARSLEDALASAEERGDPAASEILDRIRYLLSVTKGHEDPSDTAPYSNAGLASVQSGLQQVAGEVQNYASNGNVAHLTSADTYGDSTLHALNALPSTILKGGAAAAANKAFKDYRDVARSSIEELHKSNNQLRAQLQAQEAESATQLATLKSEVEALRTKITQDQARLDTALTTNNEAFSAKQAERQERFTSWLEEQGDELSELASSDLAAVKEAREAAEVALGEINGLRDDTKVVAGLAAGDQVARGYKGYSIRQWVAGLIVYAVGFASLGLGALAVIRTFRGIEPSDEISWQFAVLKLGLTVSAVVAAVVAFRLGSHLLAQAATAKRFELELKAIGPLFSRDSEQETLSTVKQDLVERSFGRGWGAGVQSKEILEPKALERIAEAVARILQRNAAP